MTVTHETGKVIAEGNGTATVFSFSPMTITASTDLEVTLVDANGDETSLSEGTGASAYAVTVSTYPGTGSITYPEDQVTPIASGVKLVMRNTIPIKQDVNLKNQGRYLADTHEKDIDDKQVMMMLRLQEETNRSLKFPKHETNTSQIPNVADRANKQLGFNASGDIIVTASDASVIDLTSHTIIPDGTTVSRTVAAVASGIPIWCGTAGGTADALTATTTPVIDEYVTGLVYRVIAPSTNATNTPTINIDSVGAKTMVDEVGASIPIGGIRAGMVLDLLYDGTDMRIINSPNMLDYAIVNDAALQTVANNTSTALTADEEVVDTRGWHDTSTNNTRLTVPAGVKLVEGFATVTWVANATGYRAIWFSKNGATTTINPGSGESVVEPESGTAVTVTHHITGPMSCVEGDYFECIVHQTSGGNLNTEPYSSFARTFFGIRRLA